MNKSKDHYGSSGMMGKGKQSSVIKPGTGSGSRPKGSKIMIQDSAPPPSEKMTLGRKGAVKALPK